MLEKNLQFIKDNYNTMCFYKIAETLQIKESTCSAYHYYVKLKPKKIKINKITQHTMCVDYLNDVSLEKIFEMYQYPKVLIFKAIEKELRCLKPTHSMYPKVLRMKQNHLKDQQIWRELDFELYRERVKYLETTTLSK